MCETRNYELILIKLTVSIFGVLFYDELVVCILRWYL